MNALNEWLKNTNWTKLNQDIECTDPAVQNWFRDFKQVVVGDGILTEDEIEGVKDFYVTANFSFKIPLKARDKYHASNLFDSMSFEPDYTMEDGRTVYGDYDTSSVHVGGLG